MPRIIILNGAGSAGKSSIAKALRAITAEPFLYVAMDAFLDMLPETYLNHHDELVFEPVEERRMASPLLRSKSAQSLAASSAACAAPSLLWRARGTILSSMTSC